MQLQDDAEAARILAGFGVGPGALLGSGGEAWVFALDGGRVLRIAKPGASQAAVELRNALLAELARSAHRVPFAISEVLDMQIHEGRIATIETRLPGRELTAAIADARGAARADLIRAYLDAADQIGDLAAERAYFGELASVRGLRARCFRDYLEAAAARSLAVAGTDFRHLAAAQLADAWPEPQRPALVHLDAFPGNMLAQDGAISAVLDFGPVSIIGDRRLDPLTAAAYLAPEITQIATAEDWQVAQQWLAERELGQLFRPAQRWLAAFWAGAIDHPRLQAWSRRVLGIPSPA